MLNTHELVARNWVRHAATSFGVTSSAQSVLATAAASSAVPAYSGNTTKRTRLVSVYNRDASNTIYVETGTDATAGGPATATVSSWAIPPGTRAILQLPTGGQGKISLIGDGNANANIHWCL